MLKQIAVSFAGAALVAASLGANAAIDDKKALEMLTKGGCTACHSIDKKGVGPSYKDVAKKRKAEKDASAMLAKKVRDGGSGAYGPIPMPPNAREKMSDDDVKTIVAWVLAL